MQIRPEYSKLTKAQLFNPCLNIKEGVSILKRALKTCKHKLNHQYTICFNKGLTGGSKIRHPDKDSYWKAVMLNYKGKQ